VPGGGSNPQAAFPWLEKLLELLGTEPRAFQDCPKRTRLDVDAFVNWHGSAAREVGRVPHLSVASGLPKKDEARTLKRADNSLARGSWQAAQAAWISTVLIFVCGSGTGRPSALRPSMYPSIASRIFASASSSVSPCDAQPGRSGT
jgi:hypothetical protein